MGRPKKVNPFIEETTTEETQAMPVVSAPTETTTQKTTTREFKNTKEVHHDLYKFSVAKMKKNLAVDGSSELDLIDVEHCHFFHTVDSNGKEQNLSTRIGGHFHLVEVIKQENGAPVVKCVSGPMHWIRKKHIDARGKTTYKTVAAPINDYDNHTHGVEYIQSSSVKQRTTNPEAAQVEAHWSSAFAKPQGVV